MTTDDNDSGPNDGKTSLAEAIEALNSGDSIHFNIEGKGPHWIATPIGGYNFITRDNVTIDGYTQPGASGNTAAFDKKNNAVIKIVLDSIGDETAPNPNPELEAQVLRRSRRMVNDDGSGMPGYGDTENAILPVFAAKNFTVRGICFVGRHTSGRVDDPAIYGVALAKGSTDAKVQGCWFGLRPDGVSVSGMRAAVTGFRYRVNIGGQNVDTFSSGLVFGTDGDGVSDRAEGNIAIGMSLALGLELPNARISGNRFNVFADGLSFLDIKEYAILEGLESVESFENGRGRENTLIGTNGDGVSDADERNVFGPSVYDRTFEFYGGNAAVNTVVAGNFFNIGVDGESTYPAEFIGAPDFFNMSGEGSVRIGSNGDGISDALEANYIHTGLGDKFSDTGRTVPVLARGNNISNSRYLGFPFRHLENSRDYKIYYASVLEGPLETELDAIPALSDATEGFLNGRVPIPKVQDYPYSVVDVYYQAPLNEEGGPILPGKHIASFVEGSAQDKAPAPGDFSFELNGLSIPKDSKLVVAVSYSRQMGRFEAGSAVTGPVSEAVLYGGDGSGQRPVLSAARSAEQPSKVVVSWQGPAGAFRLLSAPTVDGPWTEIPDAPAHAQGVNSLLLNAQADAAFFRLSSR
ncbi:MAG: hypothetical protein FJ405_04955 [Verrucomicrobia bacterium]|nr:hypothetical protein [Verrucomicrobiota bacterium]